MLARVAVVMVLVVVLGAQRAEACSCADDTRPVMQQLRDAKKKADAVFFARVVSVEHARSLEPRARPIATLEVIETFKGPTVNVLTMPTGGGADCSYPFTPRGEYLVYAYLTKEGGLSTSWCTRSREILDASDAELQWLRTGAAIPKPVAVQRELVECARCDIESAAQALTGVSAPFDRCCSKPPDGGVEQLLTSRSAVWTTPRTTERGGALELFGTAVDGGAFRLEQSPHRYAEEACRQRITRTWCSRIARGARADGEPAFSCRQEKDPVVVCDENATRTTRVPPLESSKAIIGCGWEHVDPLICGLTAKEHPLDGGATHPQLRCLQRYGVAGNEPGFRCRMTVDAGTK